MRKSLAAAIAASLVVTVLPATADAGGKWTNYSPGAPGAGDPYFPLAGNGGYDVQHYDLNVAYQPDTDELRGLAKITARATQNLSSFNLDLDGLEVRWIKVDGRRADFTRDGGELTVVPKRGIPKRSTFKVVVAYGGIPQPIEDILGNSGFLHTDDGTLVAGQPKVASTWYPVNDHPIDTASYDFEITVPAGLEAISNGVLAGHRTRHGWTTWHWVARDPMASYLTTMTVGEFDLRSYKVDGIKYWDALDPDLFAPTAVPRSGDQMALSLQGQPSYKRLTRTISVPTDAADQALTFWVDRETEPGWDSFFVEARTPGLEDWQTLPEQSGITAQDTPCPYVFASHPFLANYMTDNGDGTCTSGGSSSGWNAATGASDGYELWTIDLSSFAGTDVEISLTYANDDSIEFNGVTIDDIDVPGTAGDTGFEDDGDAADGWVATGPPADSQPNPNNWIVGTAADGPLSHGQVAEASFARQPEIVSFLAGYFGRYPFPAAGGVVDDLLGLGFALENQTRPIYARDFFGNQIEGDAVVVHEYAHQWFGDDLPLARWQDIWLNEGFATYAEWLWSEHEGLGTPQEIFDFYMAVIPPEDPFWTLPIGDPGPELLFEIPVYYRGGLTLHALRMTVGDDDFFRIVRTWAAAKSGDNVSTPQFIRLAERISGQQLDEFFETWLYTPEMPPVPATAATARVATAPTAPAVAVAQIRRLGQEYAKSIR
jgi:hypothetical protein